MQKKPSDPSRFADLKDDDPEAHLNLFKLITTDPPPAEVLDKLIAESTSVREIYRKLIESARGDRKMTAIKSC